jgi:signal transduction histidine kinase/DNA-binding response OmpR family regulator
MERIVKILLLEDNIHDAELIQHQISKNIIKYQFKHVSEFDDFSKAIDEYIPDIILSDYNLVGFTGLDALELAKQKCRLTPFIIVTGTINEETAAETIKKGAWDYVVKERLTRLDSAMKNALQLKDEKEKRAIDREKLKISEERFRKMIYNMPSGVAIYKAVDNANDFEFIDINKKAEEITKTSKKEIIGHTLLEIFPNMKNGPFIASLKKISKDGINIYLPPFFYKDDLRQGWRENYIYKLASGEIVAIFTDVTDIKEVEEQLKKQNIELLKAKNKAEESDRLKTAFLQNISHEIRTPLNGIIGFTSLLNNPNLIPEKRNNYSEIIKQSSNQLLSIISDIISIATVETGQEEINENNVNINAICEGMRDLFTLKSQSSGIPITFNTEINNNNSFVLTDETKLIQILTNLINNAFKYTNEGSINVSIKEKNSEIEFSVKDTGIGIAPEFHKKIFKRFVQAENSETRAYGGSGLGLSISKAFVQLLGGKIWLKSELNSGTTFYFTLPYKPVNGLIQANQIDNEQVFNWTGKTILIAEDDELVFLYFGELLEGTGLKILHAKNGKEAIDYCKNNSTINLVLMDIKMPVLNGYDAIKAIKEIRPTLPIIAQTAYALTGDKQKAIDAGAIDYITKPINEDELKNKIAKYVEK